jgi:hypothetical protein
LLHERVQTRFFLDFSCLLFVGSFDVSCLADCRSCRHEIWLTCFFLHLSVSIPVSVFLSVFLPAFLFQIVRLSYSAERCSHACPYQSLFVFTVHVHAYIHSSECIHRSSCLPIPVLGNLYVMCACAWPCIQTRTHGCNFIFRNQGRNQVTLMSP